MVFSVSVMIPGRGNVMQPLVIGQTAEALQWVVVLWFILLAMLNAFRLKGLFKLPWAYWHITPLSAMEHQSGEHADGVDLDPESGEITEGRDGMEGKWESQLAAPLASALALTTSCGTPQGFKVFLKRNIAMHARSCFRSPHIFYHSQL